MYNDDEWEEFSPPDKGLNPGESIRWSRRAGMSALWLFSGGCCLVSSPWILLVVYGSFGPVAGNIVLAVCVIWILLALVDFINARRTTRIIEVRSGLIEKQILLESFTGVQLSDYIEVKYAYVENGAQFYSVKLRDPSSEKRIILTGLDEDGKEIIINLNR